MCNKISPFSFLISPFRHHGQSIVELVIAFGLAAILLPAVLTGLVTSREGKAQQQQRLQALAILKEEEEATRSVRQRGWAAFAVDGTYYATVSATSSWSLVSGIATESGFTKSVTISPVNRDSSGKIVLSGGNPDPSTKKIYTKVSWSSPVLSFVDSTSYLTRYLDNDSLVDTTQTDFNSGTKNSVKVQATNGSSLADDGEIVLSQTGGYGDWCTPSLTFTALDLPKSGVANAVSATSGTGNVIAAAGTGDNASGVSYADVIISDPAFPTAPVASVAGTFDGYKTNGVFTETNYAYLATDTNGKQGVIIDLINNFNTVTKKYAEKGSLTTNSSSVDGKSIFVLNNKAYLTASNGKLYIYDITNRTGSHSPVSSFSLAGVGNKIVVFSNNNVTTAYVAIGSTSNQLQIINVTDADNPQTIDFVSVAGQGAVDLFVNQNQTRAYLATGASASQSEFFIVNIDPTSPKYKHIMGNYNTNGMSPKGVIAVSGSRGIIVGTGGTEYQVIDLSGENDTPAPSGVTLPACGSGLNIDSGINGVATVFSTVSQRAYSYIITGDATAEFKIIEGGPGGSGGNYVQTGTFTSRVFGPSVLNAAFNRFSATISQPSPNEIQLLVGVADTVNGGSCPTSYTFLGANGTASPFTSSASGVATISAGIPLGSIPTNYLNPGKCLKYQVTLNTSDSTLTPVFKDMTVNYSP